MTPAPRAGRIAPPVPEREAAPLDFDDVYRAWFAHVCRWIVALGSPDTDVEDMAQEVFLVVRRKLCTFADGNLAAWLYGIARRTVSDQRRRRWWKSLFTRKSNLDLGDIKEVLPGPAELVERREAQVILGSILRHMTEYRRVAFVLFEIEGYSTEEIAIMQQIPVATVRTRLHHARKDFFRLVGQHRRREK